VVIPQLEVSYNEESKEYIDSSIPAIIAGGEAELIKRASPELKTQIAESPLNDMFSRLTALGSLVEYDGSKGYATISLGTKASIGDTGRAHVYARYFAKATFKNGTVIYKVLLIRLDGHWLIHGFHVNATKSGTMEQGT
jgi:hypothetical protein